MSKPACAKAKPVVSAVEAAPAIAAEPRHDPVPKATPVAAAKSGSAVAKPAAVKTAAIKPAAAKPAAGKPAIAGVEAKAGDPPKAKRGRPLGSKTKPKPPVAEPAAAVAKAIAAKPAAAIARPVPAKPTQSPTKPVAPLAVATPSEGPKTMTDTMAKIQDSAKKFTGEAGARTQAMFGDMSSRAKGAYEKSVKLTEELTEFQKGNVEAIVESSKLAAKAAETLGQNAADFARKSYETGTAAFKTFASAKSPTELFKLQSDYVKSYFDSAVAESTKVTEAWLKLAGDVAQPLSNRVAVAVEKVKASAAI